jgi:hypothetical protein
VHDYSDALGPDRITETMRVKVVARRTDGQSESGTRSIAVFCVYAYNKLRHGVLTPRVVVFDPIALPQLGITLCTFLIQNLEDEDVVFDEERHEWLRTDGETQQVAIQIAPGLKTFQSIGEIAPYVERIPLHHPAGPVSRALASAAAVAPSEGIRVPAHSSITVLRVFPAQDFAKPVFGVAVHLRGAGQSSRRVALSSAYLEVRLPLEWSSSVNDRNLWQALANSNVSLVTHASFRNQIARETAVATAPPDQPLSAARRQTVRDTPAAGMGGVREVRSILEQRTRSGSFDVLFPGIIPVVLGPEEGAECDPDDIPDDLPEGMVCQLTSETAWRYVPGRVLNAKKGDVILSPGDQQIIGALLRQVSPPQYYSHSGIVTRNHVEVRHSTGSPEWLVDHPNGIMGLPTDGFEPAALKYLWPGTITQSMDQAFYFEWLNSPDTGPYKIESFSFKPVTSNTVVYPLVIKPSPFAETPTVRATLHAIAEQALMINGHYRFYCYTDPAMALSPTNVAGAGAGWAAGTVPTVCSSFIWLAAQRAGIRLEGENPMTSVDQLEPSDVLSGAEADASTRDGLYSYTAAERQSAARWLYQSLHDQARNKAGAFATFLTDAPDDVANQVCNAFASDWTDGDSKDSDAWQETGNANAVSPDNICLWDSPEPGNQHQFLGVFGHREELFFRPGTYAQVSIHRWRKVATRGSLEGTVVVSGDVSGATVSLMGSGLPDVVVKSDGAFRFDNVPSGRYEVSAGMNFNGMWYWASPSVQIDAGQTTEVTIVLNPPPEVNRLVTISVQMVTDWSSIFAHSPYPFFATSTVHLHPFHSHEHVDFEGSHSPHGKIMFDVDLNADLSINVSWTAQEIDDEVEGQVLGGSMVGKDAALGWNGLKVVNDDPIDSDWTEMNFQISNDQDVA